MILKLPTNSEPTTGGVSYLYLDQHGTTYFSDGNHAITRLGQPVAYTLNQIYKNATKEGKKTISWAMYNDEPPTNATSAQYYDFTYAHAKGVVAFDNDSGFWLIQSVPGFPPAAEDQQYSYPDSGQLNGQSMLCISLPTKSFDDIGTQFTYSNPNFYSSNFHNASLAPNLYKIVTKAIKPITNPDFNEKSYTSFGSSRTNFLSFVQTNTHTEGISDPENPDFYACIANGNLLEDCGGGFNTPLKHNLLAQTWLNSETKEPQICTPQFHVNDVASLKLIIAKATTYTWDTKIDHSKWAISADPNSNIVCFGDLNRTDSQKLRGGGTVCFENKQLHSLMASMVVKTDPCE